jgi:hypothetical protein
MVMNELLGIVRNGEFLQLTESGTPSRLTKIALQESVPPDSREIRLDKRLEGKIIAIQGLDQGGWIYSASIVSEYQAVSSSEMS